MDGTMVHVSDIAAALTTDPRAPGRALEAVMMARPGMRWANAVRGHPNSPIPRAAANPLPHWPVLPAQCALVLFGDGPAKLARAAVRLADVAAVDAPDHVDELWTAACVIALHPNTDPQTRRLATRLVEVNRDQYFSLDPPTLVDADRLTMIAALAGCLTSGELGGDAIARFTLSGVGYMTTSGDVVAQYVHRYLAQALTDRSPGGARELQYYLALLAMEGTFNGTVGELIALATPVTRRPSA